MKTVHKDGRNTAGRNIIAAVNIEPDPDDPTFFEAHVENIMQLANITVLISAIITLT